MKHLTLSLLLALCLPLALFAAEPERHTITFDGQEREYYLLLPEETADAPLVVLLHGYSGNGKNYTPRMIEEARKRGYALCSPTGSVDPKGKNSWNVGYPFQKGMTVDDVEFVMFLSRELQKTYGLSAKNTFVTGMSNGGEMCYLCAWQHPEFFGAIASMAGLTMEWLVKETPVPETPVPFMEVHGTEDRTSMWYGDPENTGGWGVYIAVPLAVSYVAAANRCTRLDVEQLPLLHPDKPSREVVLHRYTGKDNRSDVFFYEVRGGNHSWLTDDLDSPALVMDFFASHLR